MPGWLVFVVMASRGVSDCGRVLLNACAPRNCAQRTYSYPLPFASLALLPCVTPGFFRRIECFPEVALI